MSSYLPVNSSLALKKPREEELINLRGGYNGMVETEEWDRVYDYDFYDDVGYPNKKVELNRPMLGGSQDFPYPSRGRTGRPHIKTVAQFLVPEFKSLFDSTLNELDSFRTLRSSTPMG